MARRTHLPTPSAEQIRDLLDDAKISAYKAASLIGMSARSLQRALSGEIVMRGYAWLLLRVTLSRSARAELPEPVVE